MSLPPPGDVSGPSRNGGGGSPILLGRCLDPTGNIVEPLPLLLGCLHRMLASGRESLAEHHARNGSSGGGGGGGRWADPENILDDDDDEMDGGGGGGGAAGGGPSGPGRAAEMAAAEALGEALDELDGDLRRMSAALRECPLEEFDLDKVVDFSPTGGVAARTKLATAALLCGSYEALMQGSLLLLGGGGSGSGSGGSSKDVPAPAAVRGLLRLFDCRQTLLKLVRPSLPTVAQQRAKKGGTGAASSGGGGGSGGSAGGSSSSFSLEGESAGGGGGGGGGGAGLPGFSATGCFGLTLFPGGMPCLGMSFVEGMLSVLNVDPPDDEEETEGDTERDPGLVDDDAGGEPPTEVGVTGRGVAGARVWAPPLLVLSGRCSGRRG